MANVNILDLEVAIGLDGTEYFPVVQSGTTKRAQTGLVMGGNGEGSVEDANTVFAGPTSGAAAVPTFRALVPADFPAPFLPPSSDGSALGNGSTMWSDLYLASGGTIDWNNGDVLIAHSTNALAITGGDISVTARAAAATPLSLLEFSSSAIQTSPLLVLGVTEGNIDSRPAAYSPNDVPWNTAVRPIDLTTYFNETWSSGWNLRNDGYIEPAVIGMSMICQTWEYKYDISSLGRYYHEYHIQQVDESADLHRPFSFAVPHDGGLGSSGGIALDAFVFSDYDTTDGVPSVASIALDLITTPGLLCRYYPGTDRSFQLRLAGGSKELFQIGSGGGGTIDEIQIGTDIMAASAAANLAISATAFTFALGKAVISTNAAASTPPLALTGTWFSGGSATTTKPQLLIEPSAATSTGWSTSGTGLGVNAASGFAGNLLDLQVNGTSFAKITAAGALTATSVVTPLVSPASGLLTLGSDSVDGVDVKSSNSQLRLYSNGTAVAVNLFFTANGVLRLADNTAADFGRLCFGGTTSAYPALKRSTTQLQARLGDDSGFTSIQASSFQTSTALNTAVDGGSTAAFTANMVGSTGGPTTAAQYGWVLMTDSAGATFWVAVWK